MFSVPVCKVTAVRDHPEAERLSLVRFATHDDEDFPEIVSAKVDGEHRYKIDDWLVFLPENAILPEWLLREMDFWDAAKDKGSLAGSKGNRVKMRRFAGFESAGALYGGITEIDHFELDCMVIGEDESHYAQLGEDVAAALGITEYVPK